MLVPVFGVNLWGVCFCWRSLFENLRRIKEEAEWFACQIFFLWNIWEFDFRTISILYSPSAPLNSVLLEFEQMKFGSTSSKRLMSTSQTNSVYLIYISFLTHCYFFLTPIQKKGIRESICNFIGKSAAAFIEYLKWQVIGTRKLQRKGRHSHSFQAIYNLIIA